MLVARIVMIVEISAVEEILAMHRSFPFSVAHCLFSFVSLQPLHSHIISFFSSKGYKIYNSSCLIAAGRELDAIPTTLGNTRPRVYEPLEEP